MDDLENKDTNKTSQIKRFLKFSSLFALIIVLILSFVFVYENYLSPEAKFQKEQQKNYQKFQEWQARYEKAMKEDTYGGKTPEETLQLFIEALKKEDIDLAAKYFVLNTNGEQDPKWREALQKAKETGKLSYIVNLVSRAKEDKQTTSLKDSSWFVVYKENSNELEADIHLEFNKYSGVWKIESL